jgi:hypothetical protein
MTTATRWLIPDGWMPPHGSADIEGHEAVCLLNLGDEPAEIALTFYFEDAEPIRVAGLACGARRTRHLRLDRPEEIGGHVLASELPYALVVDASVPVTVQHTRVDTRSSSLALMTTAAIPEVHR